MDADLKRKWVEALLSGKFEQGPNYLYQGNRYCCMGVLIEVAEGKRPGPDWPDNIIPEYIPEEACNGLVSMNDEGVPFDMIAGLIEEAL